MKRQIIKIGSSVGIILPAQEASRLKLKAGDEVEVVAEGEGLKIVPMNRIRPIRLRGLWKGVNLSEEEINEARHEAWKSFAS